MSTLLPECVLPGCHEPVILVGEACPECVAAFGPFLSHNPAGASLSQEAIDARDNEVRAAYAVQRDREAA